MRQDHDIARWRLRSQHLVAPHLPSAADVVRSLLAVQAENPSQSAWAVAARTAAPDPADLAGCLAAGTVVRTHVLRPTWHYVAAEDVAWLLGLTAPRVRRTLEPQLRETHGLDAATAERVEAAVLDALEGVHLTRRALASALEERGVSLPGAALGIVLADLEQRALVCSGAPAPDGAHTYARFEERVPSPRYLDRDEALAELARRYVTGHGPATERDLAYWATLTLRDARAGLHGASADLERFEHDGRTFWHAPGAPPPGPGSPAGHLLQILDETYRGFQDSRLVLDVAGAVPSAREVAMGMGLVDAQLVTWVRRTVGTERVVFELQPLRRLTRADLAALQDAAARYGEFLGREPVVEVRATV
jgi:hypothetical protein